MRALISVADKTGVASFAARLADAGAEIVSTGGTLATLRDAGIPARSVTDVTGFPEILDGRVKTLHPSIHAGLLARRDLPGHLAELERHQIEPFDLVVANLYPFSSVAGRDDATLTDALENIDIGGPAMIRAAAKNFPSVIVAVDPADLEWLAVALREGGPDAVSLEQRRELAAKAFAHVSAYDATIAGYLRQGDGFPGHYIVAGEKLAGLKYGENPHQQAAIYRTLRPGPPRGVAAWEMLAGAEMSYNNYVDASAAVEAVASFAEPGVVIVKHAAPCGIATDADQCRAYEAALASDPVSAFGGIVALNRPLTAACAALIARRRYDIVIAPDVEPSALAILAARKNLRLLATRGAGRPEPTVIRMLDGAFLVQTRDQLEAEPANWRVVTQRSPSDDEIAGLRFAWKAVRPIPSNAIVLARGTATVGIGGGQPNRVEAVRLAVERAGARALGAVMASDAYFPFPDGIEVAAEAGVTAIAQPGGSVRDTEVIAAADRAGLAMVFTGVRHFRH